MTRSRLAVSSRLLEYGALYLSVPGHHMTNGMGMWVLGPPNSNDAGRRAVGYAVYSLSTGKRVP